MTTRRGFGPIEIIVLLAVVSVVAVLAMPAVIQANRLERARETAQLLGDLGVSLFNASGNPPAFRQTTGTNPSRLSHLTRQILNGEDNLCGGNYSNGERNAWDDAGPYARQVIDAAGLPTPIGTADDLLVRIVSGSTFAVIVFADLDLQDVLAMDGLVDTSDGALVGTIRWQTVGGVTSMGYFVTVDGAC